MRQPARLGGCGATVVMSFGGATGVPPVDGHGQDGRATPNHTTTRRYGVWTKIIGATFLMYLPTAGP
jgi:hypothetical protein